MQGLEAFYCRGVGDLRRQSSEKSKLFLGDWPTKKNIVGALYDVRSRFVHGNYPILRANCDYELPEELRKHEDEVSDAAGFAVRLLIASLHRCVKENITTAEFEWKLKVNRSAASRRSRRAASARK